MKTFFKPLFLALMLTIFSCSKNSSIEEPIIIDQITASDVNLQVSFNPNFENTFYPSFWISFSAYANKINQAPLNSFIINFTSPKQGSDIKIEFESNLLNNNTVIELQAGAKGKSYKLTPKINWNNNSLKELNQPSSVTENVNLYVNGELISTKQLNINYRSVNECVTGFMKDDNSPEYSTYLFSAYVNEDNPKIDGILNEILQQGVVENFTGMQHGESEILKQVSAIWYWMQSKGVTYSDITDTSNSAKDVKYQYVRFFDEVLENSQANCVDGSVFISSILKKISISPLLITTKSHMYMGFKTTNNNVYPLETTMVGNVDLREIYEEGGYAHGLQKYLDNGLLTQDYYNGYLTGVYPLSLLKQIISSNSFYNAINQAISEYNTDSENYNSQKPFYNVIDIDHFREYINPIK